MTITLDMVRDYAQALIINDPHFATLIKDDDKYYTGKGHMAFRVIEAFNAVGISQRPDRLSCLTQTFQRPILSAKDLSIGEAKALLAFKDDFKDLYVNF